MIFPGSALYNRQYLKYTTLEANAPNVCPPMSLNLRYIRQTANAEPKELPSKGPSDALSNRGLAYTRRTNKTDDLALDAAAKLSNRQKFKNTRLDIDQAVMVFIQNGLSMCDRVVFWRMSAPWNLETG